MSDTMTVRQACEHGNYDEHWADTSYWKQERCPGGKEIVLRHHSYLRKSTKDESEPFEIVPVWVEADDD